MTLQEVYGDHVPYKGQAEKVDGKYHITILGNKGFSTKIRESLDYNQISHLLRDWRDERGSISKVTIEGVSCEYDDNTKTVTIIGEQGCNPVFCTAMLDALGITGKAVECKPGPDIEKIVVKGNIEYLEETGFTRVNVGAHQKLSYYGASVKTLDFSHSLLKQVRMGTIIPMNIKRIILPETPVLIDENIPESLNVEILPNNTFQISNFDEKNPSDFSKKQFNWLTIAIYAGGAVLGFIIFIIIIAKAK